MKTNEKIKVLHFVPNLDSGGTETFIMNMYNSIDKRKVQFDFVVHTNKKGFFDDKIESLGGKIYRFPIKDNCNFIKYIKDLNNFFKEHKEYKIVHGAMPSIGFIYLLIAKHNHVPIRIAHSHSAFYVKSPKGYLKHISSRLLKYFSTQNLACSNKAGKYLFGKKEFEIIHNAIDLNRYYFNQDSRNKLRKQLNIKEDKIVLGHVGRFSKEKNHKFLIDIMDRLDKERYMMIFVGGGKTENKMKKYVQKKHLENSIIFLGVCDNVNEILNAFDIFLLPSLFEGLPTVAIEAQASGLPCIISSKVTNEVIYQSNANLLPLNKKQWINKINNTKLNQNRNFINKQLQKLYDIKSESQKLLEIYDKKIKDE